MKRLSSMKVAIRTDASSFIGTGHVFRCLALADELRLRGAQVLFICRQSQGHLGELLRGRDHDIRFISDVSTWEHDAQATKTALMEFPTTMDWLIVDHYSLDARWEEAMSPFVKRLAAIDDLANRPHAVDLLIDSSHRADEAGVYDSLVPNDTRRAIGSRYVLLRREFFATKPPKRNHDTVRRILVTFGGSDPLNATGLALDALDDPTFGAIEIDLTLGLANPLLKDLEARAARMRNVTVHMQSSRMAELMAKADLCLGAGGATSWERCYMGLPSVVLILAQHQYGIAEKLHRMGCVLNLGFADKLNVVTLRAGILQATKDSEWRASASRAALDQVDGRGIERVLEHFEDILESVKIST
jgi:UDP-2,4-diacetamido-2,4,6-trideoxy-beta-L-altropyranose hydrolase